MAELKVTFDRDADAAYIYLEPSESTSPAKQIVLEDESVRAMIIFDVSQSGQLLGIEVLGAVAAVPAELLEQAEQIG